jgi:hypothetical protein
MVRAAVTPSAIYRRIWRAVRNREPLSFHYRDKHRQAQPVVLGYASAGAEVLMAYQTGGDTSTGRRLPGWRCFYLADMRDIKSRKGGWL